MKKVNLILAGGVVVTFLFRVGVLWSGAQRPPNPAQPYQVLPTAPPDIQLDLSFPTPSEDSLEALGAKGQQNSVENPSLPGCNFFGGASYLWGWNDGSGKHLGLYSSSWSQRRGPIEYRRCCRVRYLDVYSELYADGIPVFWAQAWGWDACRASNLYTFGVSNPHNWDLYSEHCFNIPEPPPWCATAWFQTWDYLYW